MKVLIIGSGAREHALARALRLDPDVEHVHAAPGNPGIAELGTCHELPGGIEDGLAVAALAGDLGVDLVVIGPEIALVAGLADAVREAGIACFGPSARAARLEGSKSFAKQVMAAADVPTARALVCSDIEEVERALDAFGAVHVVKDDGLAAGKGVVVTGDRAQALAHAATCFGRGIGPDGDVPTVVVEEYLDGPEISLFCLTDGATVVPLAPAQDFKRVGEQDSGPNTGGMGAYSPLEWAPPDLVDDVLARVAIPTVNEMARRGTPFAGLLYIGLALTSRGIRVVEFNARFGDPETQVVLARLATPLAGLLRAAATGHLARMPPLRWRDAHAVTVVLAAAGYPRSPRGGDRVEGLEAITGPDAYVLHAGTARNQAGQIVSAGGRVLSVVGLGADLAAARAAAYEAADCIHLAGAHYRTDIGLLAHQGRVAVPAASQEACSDEVTHRSAP